MHRARSNGSKPKKTVATIGSNLPRCRDCAYSTRCAVLNEATFSPDGPCTYHPSMFRRTK